MGLKIFIFRPRVRAVDPGRARSREPLVDASLESVLMEGCANQGAATLNWILPARLPGGSCRQVNAAGTLSRQREWNEQGELKACNGFDELANYRFDRLVEVAAWPLPAQLGAPEF